MACGSSKLANCFFGHLMQNETECHKGTWTHGRTGLKQFSALTDTEQKLILWRSEVESQSVSADFTICLHHEKTLLSKYSYLQMKCCDPFKSHKSAIKRSLRLVSEELAKKMSTFKESNIKPGQKLCITCAKKVQQVDEESTEHAEGGIDEETNSDSAEENSPEYMDTSVDVLNESFKTIGVSPLKKHGIRIQDRVLYAKRKIRNAEKVITTKVAKTLDISPDKICGNRETERCTSCEDLDILMNKLQVKISASTRSEKVQLLTLAPESWSVEKTAQEFKVSQYLVKKSRTLKKNSGILVVPEKLKGKALPDTTVEAILLFYEDDEYSRMCPGKKDFVSVKIDGVRTQKQKRLLLVNLKEMHCEFKKKHPQLLVGFSKFCELRPCWCKTVNSSGSLSVCVCETHQNLKLIAGVIPGHVDYKQLLSELVCNLDSSECMVHRSADCPGQDNLKHFLQQKYEDADVDMDDNINYKQWSHGNQCNLQSLTCNVEEFIDVVTELANAATVHHYTAKSQASYLRECKASVDTDTAIILLDFAENFSFICQDAVQSFHWDTSQATLHPFVVYHRVANDNELKCISLCVISDDRSHSAVAVHTFIKEILQEVLLIKPNLKYVHYFSDGAASQYKNCKNLRNLCFHESDFGIKAEWHFFATSHGKSPCDGIGGTVKRLAARASLQATTSGHILTSQDLYNFAKTNIKGINFVYITSDTVKIHETELVPRLSTIKTVVGTRSHHRFVPADKDTVIMYRLSEDHINIRMPVSTDIALDDTDMDQYQVGKYVAAVYSNDWYIGLISERSEQHADVHVKFMKRNKRNNNLTWTATDECWVPLINILRVVPTPSVVGQSARQYRLATDIIDNCVAKFSALKMQ